MEAKNLVTPQPKGVEIRRAANDPAVTLDELKRRVKAERELLGESFDIDAPSSTGQSALFFAVVQGSAEKVSYLLAEGANPNKQDNADKTPLHVIDVLPNNNRPKTADYNAVARLLLAHNASVRIKDKEGKTAADRINDFNIQQMVGLAEAMQRANECARNATPIAPTKANIVDLGEFLSKVREHSKIQVQATWEEIQRGYIDAQIADSDLASVKNKPQIIEKLKRSGLITSEEEREKESNKWVDNLLLLLNGYYVLEALGAVPSSSQRIGYCGERSVIAAAYLAVHHQAGMSSMERISVESNNPQHQENHEVLLFNRRAASDKEINGKQAIFIGDPFGEGAFYSCDHIPDTLFMRPFTENGGKDLKIEKNDQWHTNLSKKYFPGKDYIEKTVKDWEVKVKTKLQPFIAKESEIKGHQSKITALNKAKNKEENGAVSRYS